MTDSKLVKSQVKTFTSTKKIKVNGVFYGKVIAQVRFDDQCGNGHNSFSITGDAWEHGSRRKDPDTCGCIHEIIAVAFPDLKPFLKYHLCSTESPMHYIANTLYHARDCSHKGKKVGDPVKFETKYFTGNSSNPVSAPKKLLDFISNNIDNLGNLVIKEVEHKDKSSYNFKPKYTYSGFEQEWYDCPFDTKWQAECFLQIIKDYGLTSKNIAVEFAKAVEPNLEAARNSARWPDATLEQLQCRKTLEDRLPLFISQMRSDIESLGFEW